MNSSESELFNEKPKILAVILDLDGTLLNTEMATKDILKEFLAKYGKVLDREKEGRRLGMTQKQTAVAVVKNYDLPLTPDQFIQEITPIYRQKWPQAIALPGANRLIKHLHKHGVPFALASNSLREYIDAKISYQPGWKEYFSVILGSDQVKEGKPAPYLFEEAAKRMGVPAACCLVIEDSLVGVKAAKAARMTVVAVPSQSEADCASEADIVLHSLLEFQPELWGLPPFEDCVNNVLPIDPIYMNGVYRNGSFSEVIENEQPALPDQMQGIYFGWAAVNRHEILKIVVGIGWKFCCSCTPMRKIQLCLLDGNNDQIISDQKMQLSLVGYIRRSNTKEMAAMDVEVIEGDKSIASDSLNSPMFSLHTYMPPLSETSCFNESASFDEED